MDELLLGTVWRNTTNTDLEYVLVDKDSVEVKMKIVKSDCYYEIGSVVFIDAKRFLSHCYRIG